MLLTTQVASDRLFSLANRISLAVFVIAITVFSSTAAAGGYTFKLGLGDYFRVLGSDGREKLLVTDRGVDVPTQPISPNYVVVSVTGGSQAAGQQLLDTVYSMKYEYETPPNVGNPYAIVLEPGLYELEDKTLNIPEYVTLIGAGRESTTIRSYSDEADIDPRTAATIVVNSNTELRNLTVENIGRNADWSVGIAGGGRRILLRDIFIDAWHMTPTSTVTITGLELDSLDRASIDNLYVKLNNGSDVGYQEACIFENINLSTLTDITCEALGAMYSNRAVTILRANYSNFDNIWARTAGGSSQAFEIRSSDMVFHGLKADAFTADNITGFYIRDSNIKIADGRFTVKDDVTSSIGLKVGEQFDSDDKSRVDVFSSMLDGEVTASDHVTVNIAQSKLTVGTDGSSSIQCAAVSNGSMSFFANTCPNVGN